MIILLLLYYMYCVVLVVYICKELNYAKALNAVYFDSNYTNILSIL